MDAIFRLLFAPTVWVLHFTLIYAVQSTFCVFGPPARVLSFDLVQLAASFLTVLALLAIGAATWGSIPINRKPILEDQPSLQSFFRNSMRILCLLSAIGLLWTGIPAFILHSCASLR
jgi:hypothetical protein